MGAFAGIVARAPGGIRADRLERMDEALRRARWDAADRWTGAGAALAHRGLEITSEDRLDSQPVADGDLRLVADARIDNRGELERELAGVDGADRPPSDAALILRAYRRWGARCCRHLVGDYAFAVWDGRRSRLLLARDPMGIRQLAYGEREGELLFSTSVGAVVRGLPEPPQLNGDFLQSFLAGSFTGWFAETPYSGVMRLPPGHLLLFEGGGIELRPAARPEAEAEPVHRGDEEWVEAFRAALESAVRSHLRAAGPVAVFTGGGVDSAALACLAHRARPASGASPLRFYSSTFAETPEADERAWFDDLVAWCPGVEGVAVPSDHRWAMRGWDLNGGHPLDEPRVGLLDDLTLALMRRAARDGCRVAIVGEGANQVLGQMLYRCPAALRDLGLRDLRRELPHFRGATGMGLARLLVAGFVQPSLHPRLRAALRRVRSRLATDRPWLLRRTPRGAGGASAPDKLQGAPVGVGWSTRIVLGYLRSHFNLARYCALDAMAKETGLELRYPFLDRRVVELLLRIPIHLRVRDGRERVILRQAMRGRMPESVRQRTSQADFTPLFLRGFAQEEQVIRELLRTPVVEVLGLVASRLAIERFELCLEGSSDGQALHSLISTEAWLRSLNRDWQQEVLSYGG